MSSTSTTSTAGAARFADVSSTHFSPPRPSHQRSCTHEHQRRPPLRTAAIATAVLLGATACGSSGASSSTSKPKITVILGTASDSFYNTLGCGAKAEGKKLGATVDVQGATTFDPATQTPILTSTVAKNPNAIVIAPTDSKALGTP